ncbi:MAG: cytidylate kinase-like family protein [Planctomycetota bacterium]
MQIICVSRGTYAGGKQLAETLARKLGYECLSREDLSDSATRAGIAVGKVELAVLRKRPLNEWLSIEKERFKAFVAATLSERALRAGVVYHGRLGHLQLPGVSHVLRVRAIMDAEMRIGLTMQRLGIARDKAKQYNEQVDEDRGRWIRTLYGVDWEDPAHYDLVINLSHVNIDNSAAALVSMAQLPEFQPTPANERLLKDIALAARCRLAVADWAPTRLADVQIKANSGRVLLTYLPRQRRLAPLFTEALAQIEGIQELVCTMASTNLLWIQERYAPQSEVLTQILDLAMRWDAAVELVQMVEPGAVAVQPAEDPEVVLLGAAQQATERSELGGILDDTACVEAATGDESVDQTMSRLVSVGRAGGYRRVCGGPKDLIASLDRTATYSLVVVGDVFLSKAPSVRKRLARELAAYLADKLSIPVVEAGELKEQYAFGPRQWLRLLLFGAISALLFVFVFTYQREILDFITKEGTWHRILSTACLLVFVPLFAYLYGNFARSLLRLFRFE